ncbi:hypothetical protein F4212_02810 [Candidatus Poribacteria bacterium]|nr:hypothetical protein [Candidatus Poribacteria bacterium]
MKIKRIIVFFIVFGVVVLGITSYFIFRPHPQVSITPQEFAQVPEKPKLIAKFTTKYQLSDAIGAVIPEGFRYGIDERSIYSVAFSPVDASLIASINGNGIINLWNRDNTEVPVKVLSHPEIYSSIGFSPNGKLLVSASWKLVLWDVATGKKINTLETSFNQFAFSADGKLLATIPVIAKYFQECGVKIWDIQNPKTITEVAVLPFNNSACAVGISSDGKWIAAGYTNGIVNVWDLQTHQIVKTLDTSMYQMDYLKFSPNNTYMVAGGDHRELYPYYSAKGYIMWELPSWERKGEVLRGHIENMSFSPDGKLCANANHQGYSGRGIEIWDISSGASITSIIRGTPLPPNEKIPISNITYPLEPRDVSFSQDGRLVATGDNGGVIRVWELTPEHLSQATKPLNVVRILYLLPTGKTPLPDIRQKLDTTLKSVQKLYADEMERHGFGRKTFTYETDENGKAKVYLIKEKPAYTPDFSNDIWLAVYDEKPGNYIGDYQIHNLSANKTFRYPGKGIGGPLIGYCPGKLVTTSIKNLKRNELASVLRPAFDLPNKPPQRYESNALIRLFKRMNTKMPWVRKWHKLARCEAEWLDKSRFFNPEQPFFDKRPAIAMNVSNEDGSDTRLFKVAIRDDDGIHQVQLLIEKNIGNQQELYNCQALNGKKKADVVFRVTDPKIHTFVLRMIDMHGNIAQREFIRGTKSKEP